MTIRNGKMESPTPSDTSEPGEQNCFVDDSTAATPVSYPDPEVPMTKQGRRSFNARYKQRILKQAEGLGPGELGALLRREGLYHSHLSSWRKQREEAIQASLEPRQRGPKEAKAEKALEQRVADLEKEKNTLAKELENLHVVLDIQKKTLSLCEVLTTRRLSAS